MTASPPELRGECEGVVAETSSDETRQKASKSDKKRQLSGLDWAAIRHAVESEGAPAAVLAAMYGVTPGAINQRKRRYKWASGPNSATPLTTEEILGMRNMRTIGRILRSMEKKFDGASALDPAQENVAARSVQTLTRAAENAATTRRKNKAHDAKQTKPAFDREALERKLLGMEAKLGEAELPQKPE
jgi:hypothetical protein